MNLTLPVGETLREARTRWMINSDSLPSLSRPEECGALDRHDPRRVEMLDSGAAKTIFAEAFGVFEESPSDSNQLSERHLSCVWRLRSARSTSCPN